jgi:copper chaperone CopZ
MNTFILKGLHCDACAKVCTLKIKKIDGVTDVRVTRNGEEALGELDAARNIGTEEIQEALAGTDYTVIAA